MPRIIEGTSMNITGEKIKYYRKMRKLSQQQLSDKLETLAVYICRDLFPESRTVHEQLQILNFMDYQRYFKCRLKSFLKNKGEGASFSHIHR